jgi:hypothetical protein
LTERRRSGSRTVSDKRETYAKEETSQNISRIPGRLQVKLDHPQAVHCKYANHPDDDRREHHFDNGEVFQKEHADQDVMFGDASLLQQKTKRDPEHKT